MSDGKVIFDITGNLSGIDSALNQATSNIAKQTAKWTVLGQTAMNALASGAKVAFNAVKDLAQNAFEYNTQMQTYEVNFKTMLGSAEAAQVKMAELKQYAAKTPFAFGDLADATQTMLSFGLTSEEATLALKHLGDISLGDANKLKSLTLAFSQISSTGKLASQDLLQMINAGFNPLKIIAEETGAAYADLKAVMSGEKTSEDFQLRMEAARREVEELGVNASQSAIMLAQIGKDGMISADMVAAAMRIATSEGGTFYKALENASATTKGQIATIQDSWDMLSGKVTGGLFDQLSTNVLPKVITWLDELNAAYDKDGWAGLKGAAGGIFDELGQMALNMGSGILANIYNGITGESKTADEISAYLSGLWTDATTSLTSFTDAAGGLLGTIWTSITGQEATAASITGTIGGLFQTGIDGITSLIDTAATFMTDLNTAIGDDTLGTGDKIAAVFTAGSTALEKLLTDGASFFVNLYNAITGSDVSSADVTSAISSVFTSAEASIASIAANASTAVTKIKEFFTVTIPDEWNQTVTLAKDGWNNICLAVDLAAKGVLDFFGVEMPEDWSLCDDIAAKVKTVYDQTVAGIKALKELAALQANPAQETYNKEAAAAQEKEAQERSPSKFAGKYAHLAEEVRDEMYWYIEQAIKQGHQGDISFDSDLIGPELLAKLRADVSEALNSGEFTVEVAETWFENAGGQLQSQLNQLNLSVNVNPRLSNVSMPSAGGLHAGGMTVLFSRASYTHASGGIFNAATRFLGEDGMHTFGESGTEVLLPLDALWSKMGMIFDQTFSAKLAGLQYNVMPQLPAAAPVSAGIDEDRLSETIAAAVREAVSGLTVEMDKRKVGKIVAPEVSRDLANEVNGRKWTA